jgi:hypothetical protein
MPKLELFTVNEISRFLGFGTDAVYKRIKSLNLIAYKKQNKKTKYYSREQMIEIKNYYVPKKQTPDVIVTIHKYTEWHIYPSKLNFIDI